MRKRDYGDGSIANTPRKDGRWPASFYLPDGTRKYVYGKTRQEAKLKLEEAQRQAERGELVAPDKARLADYLLAWLEIKKLRLKHSSYLQYRAHITAVIAPVIGAYPVQKLTARVIQGFISALCEQGKAPGSIRMTYAILSQALKDAVRRHLIGANPCQDIVLPRDERENEEELHALDAEQAQALLRVARGDRFECIVTLALAAGLRRGELLALRWSDIDFERGILRVQRQLTWNAGEGYRETTPKTRGSRRAVPVAGFALAALRVHRTRQKEQRLAAGTAWQEKNLVFCNETGGYLCPQTLRRGFLRLLAAAGLPPMHFHDLRHTSATLLVALGTPLNVVQAILGHTTARMTLRYLHALPAMREDAVSKLDTLFTVPVEQAFS